MTVSRAPEACVNDFIRWLRIYNYLRKVIATNSTRPSGYYKLDTQPAAQVLLLLESREYKLLDEKFNRENNDKWDRNMQASVRGSGVT